MEFTMCIRDNEYTIEILSFWPARICRRVGHPDNWWPDEEAEMEFEILNAEGEVVDIDLTRDEQGEIEEAIIAYVTDAASAAQEEYNERAQEDYNERD